MSETATMAKKRQPGMATLVLVLFAISAATALLLGLVNMVTAPVIRINEEKKVQTAMQAVLPSDTYDKVDYTGEDQTIEAVYRAGDAGYVFQVSPAGSFSGTLTIMVGVNADGTCSGVSIVKTAETSGLGANASKPVFRDQFAGQSGPLAVSKDGGSINALTGATITSRAVTNGVNSALEAAQSLG